MAKDDLPVDDYQHASQVRQALAELANARELGLPDSVIAANKRLDALTYTGDRDTAAGKNTPPAGRRAPEQPTAAENAGKDKADSRAEQKPAPAAKPDEAEPDGKATPKAMPRRSS